VHAFIISMFHAQNLEVAVSRMRLFPSDSTRTNLHLGFSVEDLASLYQKRMGPLNINFGGHSVVFDIRLDFFLVIFSAFALYVVLTRRTRL